MIEKKIIKIRLQLISDVYEFVRIVSKYGNDIDLYSTNNSRHAVDAKSIMGLFSINLSDDLIVEMIVNDLYEVDGFNQDMEKFRID